MQPLRWNANMVSNAPDNLAHCFCCGKNLNNIALGYDFRAAATLLERWLNVYQAKPATAD